MLRFTDIIQGRHSTFEPKLSHAIVTLIVFLATHYLVNEFRYSLPWYAAILLLITAVVSAIGLVVSFGSVRHPKMFMIQALALGYIASLFAHDWTMQIAYGAGTFVVVCFIVPRLCRRYLKLRNIWETSAGILAFCVLYPHTLHLISRLIY